MAKTFLFFCSWADNLADFSPEDRCAVYDAIIAYAQDGTLPDNLHGEAKMAFKFMKKDVERAQVRYDDLCEKRRAAINARWQRLREEQENTTDTNEYKCIQNVQVNTNDTNVYKRTTCIHDKDKDKDKDKDEYKESNDSINTEKERESKKESEPVRRFRPPTQEEVLGYSREKGYEIDAGRFMDYYESIGWKVGNHPMKDWKAAVRTWIARDKATETPSKRLKSENGTDVPLGVDEWITAQGNRTYGTSGKIVPKDAPPRPSKAHWWSDASGRWEDLP